MPNSVSSPFDDFALIGSLAIIAQFSFRPRTLRRRAFAWLCSLSERFHYRAFHLRFQANKRSNFETLIQRLERRLDRHPPLDARVNLPNLNTDSENYVAALDIRRLADLADDALHLDLG